MASDCTIHGGVPGEVDSFNGRSGIVVPEAGDYDSFFLTQAEGDAWYAPAGSLATNAARADRTAGDLTLNSVTWADLDNGLDLVLSATEGDFVEVGISGAFSAEAVNGFLDVVSVVAGAPVNSWATAGAVDVSGWGVLAWRGVASVVSLPGGSVINQLVAGDVDAGTVTLRCALPHGRRRR